MAPNSTQRPLPASDPFTLLYLAHFRFVIHRARLAGVPARYCQDVAQEVFATLDREMKGGLDTSKPLWGWLATTTFRKATDWLRLARNREQPAEGAAVGAALPPETIMESQMSTHADRVMVDETPSPEQTTIAAQMARHAHAVLDDLPDSLRVVLVMATIEDMPVPEIAVTLAIPEGTAKTRLRMAKQRARELWEQRVGAAAPAVLPFALWNVEDLLQTQRPVPPAPPGIEAAVLRRLRGILGPGLASAGAGAAAGAGAGKVAALLLGKKVLLATIASLGIAAGVVALWSARRGAPEEPTVTAPTVPPLARAPASAGSATAAVEAISSAPAPVAPSSAAPAVVTTTLAGAPARSTDADERASLESARAALGRHDPAAARAALARVKGQRFAEEREALQRVLLSYPADGGP